MFVDSLHPGFHWPLPGRQLHVDHVVPAVKDCRQALGDGGASLVGSTPPPPPPPANPLDPDFFLQSPLVVKARLVGTSAVREKWCDALVTGKSPVTLSVAECWVFKESAFNS